MEENNLSTSNRVFPYYQGESTICLVYVTHQTKWSNDNMNKQLSKYKYQPILKSIIPIMVSLMSDFQIPTVQAKSRM